MRDTQRMGRASLATLLMVGLALLVATLLAPVSGLARSPGSFEVAQGEQLGVGSIRHTLYTLKHDYVEKVNYNALLKSSAQGVQVYLKEKKIKFAALDGFPKGSSADANLLEYQDLLNRIMTTYKGKIDNQKLISYALKGLMFGLKDPYSVSMDAREYRRLKESMSGGNFGGVGIYIELDKHNHNQLIVVEPIEDTPGARAGLKPGDQILTIDGTSTKGIDLDSAARHIRGPVGSTVALQVKRKGEGAKTYRLMRQLIHVKSATGKMLPEHVAYIRIRFFGEDTGQEFEDALSRLEKQGARALIVDVRNNGGGYIKAAQDVCNLFLPSGQLIVSVVNYRKKTNEPHKAYGSSHPRLPMVCLINGYSASASEITAGALRDTQVAVLMGTKSFGKGSVQTMHEMPDGGALKFTIAHYLTPSGRDINKIGIKPDVEVKMDAARVGTPKDLQLDSAQKYLKKQMAGG